MTILKNVLRFQNVAPGPPGAALPHGLNYNGLPVVPDVIFPNAPGVTIGVNDENVTVEHVGPGNLTVDVLVEKWHTFDRAVPIGINVPFVGQVGGDPGPFSLPIVAAGHFQGNGTIVRLAGIAVSVTRTGAGTYRVLLAEEIPFFAVVATGLSFESPARIVTSHLGAPDEFFLQARTPDGTFTDTDIMFAVVDLGIDVLSGP